MYVLTLVYFHDFHDFFQSKYYALVMIGLTEVRFHFSFVVFVLDESVFGFVVTYNGAFFQCHAVGISPNGEGLYCLQASQNLMVTA